jgi:energy-coupling factor transporter ATP-binding protein EcfA2
LYYSNKKTGVEMSKQNLLNILETDDDYALMLVYRMISTLLESVDPKTKFAYRICNAIEGNLLEDFLKQDGVTFKKRKKKKTDAYHYSGEPKSNAVNRDDWKMLRQYFSDKLAGYEKDTPNQTPEIKNIHKLSRLVGFNELQQSVLEYVYAIRASDLCFVKLLGDALHGHASKFPALVAMAMGRQDDHKEIVKYFGKNGIFSKYGVIEYDDDGVGEECIPQIEEFLRAQISDEEISDDDLLDALIGKACVTDLTISENFPHLEDEAKKLANIIAKAKEMGKQGINIAVYGPTGSGKSEFVKALASMMEKRLYAIGESDSDNTQYSSEDKKIADKRMSSLLRAQAILKDDDDALLLMDEFEDLVPNKSDSSKQADPDSKILLNRVLEENFTVTIWACNDIGKFHESFRSRFFTSVFVGYQPTVVRKNIWGHHLDANGLSLSSNDVLSLARRYEAPPRAIAMACEGASLTGEKISDVHEQMEDKARILKGNRYAFEAGYLVPENYDTDFLTCSENLASIEKDILEASRSNAGGLYMFKGPKGTGRSTFSYYLAEQMARLPVEEDMRELVLPTQFSSPAGNILRAFANAADSKALLTIDNFDAMFSETTDSDREEMSEIFWSFMKDSKVPVILMSEDTSKIGEDFKTYVDGTLSFNEMDEDHHKMLSGSMIGKDIPFKPGVTIGSFMKAVHSIRVVVEPVNDSTVEKRIAASAQKPRRIGF